MDLADGLEQLANYIQDVLNAAVLRTVDQSEQIRNPEETLQMLLEADDLEVALQQYESRLDAPLLDLVRRAAIQAREDNEAALADGLTILADYIAEVLKTKASSQ